MKSYAIYDEGSIEVVKNSYNQAYLDFDVMAAFHHGQNVFDSYVDYFTYKTVLYTTFVTGSQTANWHEEENERMQKRALECMSWGDGAKILTFPYTVGTATKIPLHCAFEGFLQILFSVRKYLNSHHDYAILASSINISKNLVSLFSSNILAVRP